MTSNKQRLHRPERDSLTAINDDGSRYVIHPADAQGRFSIARRLSAAVLIAIYAALPWIKVNEYPAVFLDTDAMRFHFLGLTFASQDLWLAFFLISGLGFGLFYVTALFGRVWCGWACPQTVFLEHVYRRIERWIEGDAAQRRQLDLAKWGGGKLLKRGIKHLAFVGVSVAVAHLFMAYFLSVPQLWEMMRGSPGENWAVFVFVFVFSGILYFNFAWFREQLCIIVCPYGRLQSALIDDDSVVIGYDEKRGEPRGKASKEGVGDCIDCNRCVQVCPTGIDIRQGLQMECIGCAACIDACDTIMDKLKRPRGLVRYDSMNGLNGGRTKWLRPRIFLYTALLLLGVFVMSLSFGRLGSANLTAWRVPGAPYYLDEGAVRNQFMARITNKKTDASFYRLSVVGSLPEAIVSGVDDPFLIEGNGELVKTLVVLVPKPYYTGAFSMTVQVLDENGKAIVERDLEFVGPDSRFVRSNQ